ncbi:MAG: helix-turn-helix domain-containing protein [Actinomycetota bacterium]|nr:helix-turn-helix domain-containing protein [Actinomycetota bacterium]
MTQVPALATVTEVAELCRVDDATVRRWITTGKLAAIKLPGGERGNWRIRRADVDAFLVPNSQSPEGLPA